MESSKGTAPSLLWWITAQPGSKVIKVQRVCGWYEAVLDQEEPGEDAGVEEFLQTGPKQNTRVPSGRPPAPQEDLCCPTAPETKGKDLLGKS